MLVTFPVEIISQYDKFLGDLGVQESISISSHQHDEIKAILQFQMAEPFPDLSLDAVALYGSGDVLLGYDKSQSRHCAVIGNCKYKKVAAGDLVPGMTEYVLKVVGIEQPR